MWGLKKKALQTKSKTVRYVYKEFAIGAGKETDKLGAVESRNCDCRGGKLTTGIGMEYYLKHNKSIALRNAEDVSVRLYAVQKKLVQDGAAQEYQTAISYMTEDGLVYMYDQVYGWCTQVGTRGSETAVASFMCHDKITITAWAGHDGVSFLSVGEGFSETDLTVAKGVICSFHHRLFVAKDPYTIVYNDPADPKVFSDALDSSGEITFPSTFGEIIGLQPLGERLYVFFEYAIFRLEAKGAATEFKAIRLGYDGGKIFIGSIGACGDGIFFLTEQGAHRFDGKTERLEPVCQNLSLLPMDNGQICYHATHTNTFFLRFYDKEKGMRTVALENTGKSGYEIFDVDGLSESEGIAFGTWQGAVGVLSENGSLPSGEKYTFKTEALRFGSRKQKTLKSLRVFGKGCFTLRIGCGKYTIEKQVEIENGDSIVEIKEKAESFVLEFDLQKGTEITGLIAEIEQLA